jgi:hypothetical protein
MKYIVIILLILVGAAAAAIAFDNDKRMYSHDLGCADYTGRAGEICRSLSREMQWEWLGHAIVSPGWRVTFQTMRQVYCKNAITTKDIPALKEMAGYEPFKMIDARLENGAVGLLTLLRTRPETKAADIPDSAFDAHSGIMYAIGTNSIFNPQNPSYILRGGCPASSGNPD